MQKWNKIAVIILIKGTESI